MADDLVVGSYARMAGDNRKAAAAKGEAEVTLQITIPPRVKRSLDLKSVKTGRTRRALVLEGLRQAGVTVTDEDIAGRRARKPK